MKKRRREARLEAEKRWPQLFQFLAGYCHQDWPEMYGTPPKAVEAAVADYTLEMKQSVMREWRDWNSGAGAVKDIRSLLNDGFGVNVWFKTPLEARNFMNYVYDKLTVAVRKESTTWKH